MYSVVQDVPIVSILSSKVKSSPLGFISAAYHILEHVHNLQASERKSPFIFSLWLCVCTCMCACVCTCMCECVYMYECVHVHCTCTCMCECACMCVLPYIIYIHVLYTYKDCIQNIASTIKRKFVKFVYQHVHVHVYVYTMHSLENWGGGLNIKYVYTCTSLSPASFGSSASEPSSDPSPSSPSDVTGPSSSPCQISSLNRPFCSASRLPWKQATCSGVLPSWSGLDHSLRSNCRSNG